MSENNRIKTDIVEPETEPVTFVDITLNCGRVLELAVKPKQGDTRRYDVERQSEVFTFPKFHLTQEIFWREVAAISTRESVITILPPKKEKA
jgi:hypothetical protein